MFNDTFQVPVYKGTVHTKIKMLKVNFYNIINQVDNNSIIEIIKLLTFKNIISI